MIEQSYLINRQNFCAMAQRVGAKCFEIPYKRTVPEGETLVTNIALLGPDNASHVVVIVSGVHGVELPAGSLLQQLWLENAKNALTHLTDTRFVFVHALNPYGAAYGMRTDWDMEGQGNIDPARNFIDFAVATNAANPDIAAIMLQADLSCFGVVQMWMKLLHIAFIKQGKTAFKRGFVRGQYTHPDAPYYGGKSPSLTRLTWDEVIAKYVRGPQVKKIWHLDCHTGDGPFGLLQLYINNREGGHVYDTACRLMPHPRIQMTEKYFADIAGDIVDYWSQCGVAGVEVTPMTLEFGTSSAVIEGIDVLHAILTRTILQQRYGGQHKASSRIVQRMRDAFAPRKATWFDAVQTQALEMWYNIEKNLV